MTTETNGLSKHEALEIKFADWLGIKYAAACSSGTAALCLAFQALGIREGDEVIVPDFTMIACANAVRFCGATPVFVDCDDKLNIDVKKIIEKITLKTRAILAVHIYGRVCEMDELKTICSDYNLFLVEDCAEAHGATYKGNKVGTIGDIACFSFYKNKIVHGEEGGIVVSNNQRLIEQVKDYRSCGFGTKHNYLHPKYALNFRLADLLAVPIIECLEVVDATLKRRREIEHRYDDALEAFKWPKRPQRDVVWVYDRVTPDARELVAFLQHRDIPVRNFFQPMTSHLLYGPKRENSKASWYANSGFYLPCNETMTNEEQDKIIDKIRLFYAKKS